MTTSEKPTSTYFERLAKKYGANIFLLIAIGYLYKDQMDSKSKIQALESRVFECYESRSAMINRSHLPLHSKTYFSVSKEAILPSKKKYRFTIS